MAPLETRLLINGERVAGQGEPLAVENPFTEEALASVPVAAAEQVDAAVAAAAEGTRQWAPMPAIERCELLHEVASRLRARTEELAQVMTLEGGKPLIENSDEVGWTAAAFDYYAELGRNFAGRVIPSIESTQLALVLKEPIGVVGCIVPWNYPLLLLAWKLAPALAAGNTAVCKPSELTPLSTLMLADCFEHLPDGVVNLLAGAGDVGEALVRDERVGCVAFTGSVETGKRVAALCAERVARVNLEMGGKDPFIVCDDVAERDRGGGKGRRLGRLPECRPGMHVGRALLCDGRCLRGLRAGFRGPHELARAGRSRSSRAPTSGRWSPSASATGSRRRSTQRSPPARSF